MSSQLRSKIFPNILINYAFFNYCNSFIYTCWFVCKNSAGKLEERTAVKTCFSCDLHSTSSWRAVSVTPGCEWMIVKYTGKHFLKSLPQTVADLLPTVCGQSRVVVCLPTFFIQVAWMCAYFLHAQLAHSFLLVRQRKPGGTDWHNNGRK